MDIYEGKDYLGFTHRSLVFYSVSGRKVFEISKCHTEKIEGTENKVRTINHKNGKTITIDGKSPYYEIRFGNESRFEKNSFQEIDCYLFTDRIFSGQAQVKYFADHVEIGFKKTIGFQSILFPKEIMPYLTLVSQK